MATTEAFGLKKLTPVHVGQGKQNASPVQLGPPKLTPVHVEQAKKNPDPVARVNAVAPEQPLADRVGGPNVPQKPEKKIKFIWPWLRWTLNGIPPARMGLEIEPPDKARNHPKTKVLI